MAHDMNKAPDTNQNAADQCATDISDLAGLGVDHAPTNAFDGQDTIGVPSNAEIVARGNTVPIKKGANSPETTMPARASGGKPVATRGATSPFSAKAPLKK